MSRYVINPLASPDLNEIADYFAENSLEVGEKFFRAFNRKCQQLSLSRTVAKAMQPFVLDSEGYLWKVTSSFTEFWMTASKF